MHSAITSADARRPVSLAPTITVVGQVISPPLHHRRILTQRAQGRERLGVHRRELPSDAFEHDLRRGLAGGLGLLDPELPDDREDRVHPCSAIFVKPPKTSASRAAGAAPVSINTSERTRSGCANTYCIEMIPPIEWPRRSNGARSRAATKPARSAVS
jgi:hypothetical protein